MRRRQFQSLARDVEGIVHPPPTCPHREWRMLLEQQRPLVQRNPLEMSRITRLEPCPFVVGVADRHQPDHMAVKVCGDLHIPDNEHDLGETDTEHATPPRCDHDPARYTASVPWCGE